MTELNDIQKINRHGLARAITDAGDVRHDAEGYYIVRDVYQGEPRASIVRRKKLDGDRNRIVCDCADFTEQIKDNPLFDCEHIIAVRNFAAESPSQPRTWRSDR